MRMCVWVGCLWALVACGPAAKPCLDADGDGACGAADCDDANPLRHPGAAETCNGVDDNCDGRVDDGPGTWCLWRSVGGELANGEAGFRFGPLMDLNADGTPEVLLGSRYNGVALDTGGSAGAYDVVAQRWLWTLASPPVFELFGQVMLAVPDVTGDGVPDVVMSAPQRPGAFDVVAGWVSGRSGADGSALWEVTGDYGANLGWHLCVGEDGDQDGVPDVWLGDPNGRFVSLHSSRTGREIRRIQSEDSGFGWYCDAVPDVDGDGTPELVVGALSSATGAYVQLFNGHTGAPLRQVGTEDPRSSTGLMVAGLPDVDGDGAGDVAVGSPYQGNAGEPPGSMRVVSGADGHVIWSVQGDEPRELFGRALAPAGDVDGDGVGDVAVSAPFASSLAGSARAGRVQVRSGKDGRLLLERRSVDPGENLGWHVLHHPDAGGRGIPGLLVGALHATVGDKVNAGRIDIMLYGR